MHVVAPEGLHKSCLDLYDGSHAVQLFQKTNGSFLGGLPRSQGVAQSQLGKEFKTGGNKMFYVLKSLKSRGLVVRHATRVRTHQPASKRPNNKFMPIVGTNLVHLSRYEKDQDLGSHTRYEIPSSCKSKFYMATLFTSGDVGAGGGSDPRRLPGNATDL